MLIYGKYIFQRSANNNRQNSEEKLEAVNAITTKCLSQAMVIGGYLENMGGWAENEVTLNTNRPE